MKFKILFITLTLGLVCGGSLLAKGVSADASPMRVLRAALDLTEDQVIEIRALVEARAVEIKSIADQIHMLQRQQEEALKSDAPDPMEVGELVLEVRMLRAEIGKHREDFRMAFRLILTPRQMERVGHINRIALANRAAEALSQLGLR